MLVAQNESWRCYAQQLGCLPTLTACECWDHVDATQLSPSTRHRACLAAACPPVQAPEMTATPFLCGRRLLQEASLGASAQPSPTRQVGGGG